MTQALPVALPLTPYLPQPGQSGHIWLVRTAAVLAAVSLANSVAPAVGQVRRCLSHLLRQPRCEFTFPEASGSGPDGNYDLIRLYLSNLDIPRMQRLTVTQPRNTASPIFTPHDDEQIGDMFQGVSFSWTHFGRQQQQQQPQRRQHRRMGSHYPGRNGQMLPPNTYSEDGPNSPAFFQVTALRKLVNRDLLRAYLHHVRTTVLEIQRRSSELQVYDNTRGLRGQYGAGWTGQIFKHPSTFHTLALDPAIHHRVITSLNSFKADADYYNKIGRAHKMGIFLFGPPGTGKTSFIAAVANLMHYDVYCLDLSTVPGDKALRELEVQIPDKALIVMEDIDVVGLPKRDAAAEECEDEADPSAFGSFVTDFDRPPIGLYNRMPQSAPPSQQRGTSSALKEPSVTLAGLLNFTDGLRSACAAQHIFIFTSNHPERLDPALTRPGRMDLHVELSYCTFGVFQQLCKSHMQVEQHMRSNEVKQLLARGCKITPAFVAGTMHEHRLDVNAAFDHIICKLTSSKPNAD